VKLGLVTETPHGAHLHLSLEPRRRPGRAHEVVAQCPRVDNTFLDKDKTTGIPPGARTLRY
jgi:hypothetical protein